MLGFGPEGSSMAARCSRTISASVRAGSSASRSRTSSLDGGEPFGADFRQIAPAALDVEHLDGVTEKIGDGGLGGSIAAAVENQCGIASQQTGGVDTLGEKISPAGGGFIGVPKTLHKREKRKKAAANPSQDRL